MNRYRQKFFRACVLLSGLLLPVAARADPLTPLLGSPIYEGAQDVLVMSLQDGTKVSVFVRQLPSKPEWTSIGDEAVARGGRMPLRLQRVLAEGEELHVKASRVGEGEATSEPVTVTSLPASLPEPIPTTAHLVTKSQCAGATTYPSAVVTARSPSGDEDRGNSNFLGLARVIFEKDHQLQIGDFLKLNVALAGKKSASDAKLPIRRYEPSLWKDKVPPPKLGRLEACDRVVALTGHQPGAEFKIVNAGQTGGSSGRFTEDDPAKPLETLFGPYCSVEFGGLYLLARELQEGWEVRAKQEFKSKPGLVLMPSAGSDHAVVAAAGKPVTPALPTELLVGGTTLEVSNLDPSATVLIRIDADDPSKSAKFEDVIAASGPVFRVPALPAGWVRVRQTKCGKDSDLAEVRVKAAAGPPRRPRILTPLYACASTLTVVDRVPSAWIRVSVPKGPTLEGTGPHLGVAPQLSSDWKNITAIQEAGGLKSDPSDPVSVEPAPESLPILKLSGAGVMKGLPNVDICSPAVAAMSEADGKPIKRGAALAFYAGDSLVGAGPAITESDEAREISVPLAGTFLELGATIEGTQRLCSVESQRSAPLTVTGKLNFTNPDAYEADVSNQVPRDVSIAVKMGCPLWTATKVRLVSANPSIAEVLAPAEKDITVGDTTADFQVRVKKGGVVSITGSATHFVDAVADVRGCDWDTTGSPQTVKFLGTKPTGSTDTVDYYGYLNPIPSSKYWRVDSMHNKTKATLQLIRGNKCTGQSADVILTLGPGNHLDVPAELKNQSSWNACVRGVDVTNPPLIDVDVYYRKWPNECTMKPQ